MRKIILLQLCIATFVLSCRKVETSLDQNFKIDIEECKIRTFGNEKVRLCFDELVQDSRCPANAICIWQGVAQARFSFTVNNFTYQFVLSTNKVLPGTITDTTINNYNISLKDIQPYPGTGNAPVKAEVLMKKQ